MNAKERARSMTRLGRVPVEAIDRNLKAHRERRTASHLHANRVHIPLNLSSEPRTDLSAAQLEERPWLRFYSPDVPLDLVPTDQTLPGLLRESAGRFAQQTALIYFGQKISYKELDVAADHFATGLWNQGIRPGDRVALLLPNCPHFVIAYYGALRIGAIVVPCNPTYVERELEHQLRDAGATVLVGLTLFHKLIETMREKVGLKVTIIGNVKDYFPPALQVVFTVAKEKKEGHRAEVGGPGVFGWLDFLASAEKSEPAPPVEIKPDDIALYQYTGGTTGVPKAAMLNHRSLVMNARMCWAWVGEGEKGRDVTLAAIPFFHVYGMTTALNLTIFAGGALVLLPRFVPLDVLKAIQRYHPTLFPGVPAMYIALMNHPQFSKFDLSSVEACLSGAAPLPLEVATRFEKLTGARLIEGFGMTESSPVTHANPVFGKRKDGSIGLPFPGVKAKIVDLATGECDLPIGERGELVVSGPTIMQGYYNRPEETAQTIRNGWLYTGDIARMDADGYFFIVDRKKDMILSNGFNVYPRDIEEVLYQHLAIKEAVVIGAPNVRGDDTVKAFVVLKEGESVTEEELIAFCREHMARYKAPRAVEFREVLPKTLIGKHLRRVLVEEEKRKLTSAIAQTTAESTSQPTTVRQIAVKRQLHLLDNLARNLPKVEIKVTMPENFHLPKPRPPKVRLPWSQRPDGGKAAS